MVRGCAVEGRLLSTSRDDGELLFDRVAPIVVVGYYCLAAAGVGDHRGGITGDMKGTMSRYIAFKRRFRSRYRPMTSPRHSEQSDHLPHPGGESGPSMVSGTCAGSGGRRSAYFEIQQWPSRINRIGRNLHERDISRAFETLVCHVWSSGGCVPRHWDGAPTGSGGLAMAGWVCS